MLDAGLQFLFPDGFQNYTFMAPTASRGPELANDKQGMAVRETADGHVAVSISV